MGNALNINQMTRWVNTKEEHASKIITLMSEYALCQRVKPVSDPKSPFKSEGDYVEALRAHHAVMTAAVTCKQQVDPAKADALEEKALRWQRCICQNRALWHLLIYSLCTIDLHDRLLNAQCTYWCTIDLY